MKKSTVLRLGFLAGIFLGSAAQGQVFNVHQVGQQGFAFYNGYNVVAFGQGAAHDPGNNIWNGFGNGGGPGQGWCFGSPHTDDQILPGNPGNPYAWTTPPAFANGPALFSPTLAASGSAEANAGNATSAGAHSPITIPSMVYGANSGNALGTNGYVRTNVAAFVFSGAAIVNSTGPGIGTPADPLGSITLSNVPPGNYDLYLYAANFDGTRGATFFSSSGTPSNGVSVAMNPYATNGLGPLTNFIFGTNFVVFNNVSPAADSTIKATWGAVSNVNSGFNGEGDFNGLQLAVASPVAAAPFINQQPSAAIFSQGTTASLAAQISGYPAPAFQWFEGAPPGSPVSGQTSSTLTFPSSLASQSGNYFLVGTNVHGAVTSSVVSLTIAAAPLIVAQSSTNGLILYHGQNHFGMSITDFGAAPLVYFWRANGVAAAITTNVPSVNFSNITVTAVYDCVISNSFGRATNNPMSVTVISAPTTPYATAVLALSPFAYWPLTENSGFVAYDYVGANNGAVILGAGTGFPGPSSGGFGTPSYAYNFDGTTGYLDVPGAPINFTGPLSLVAWTSGGGSGFQTTAGKGDTSYRLDQEGNGTAHFANGTGPDAAGGPNLKNGSLWHQVVGVYDGSSSNIYLYVDGIRVNTQRVGTTPGNSLDFWIGGAPDYGNGRLFSGSMGHVALFNYALSAAQVLNLYAAGQVAPFILTDVVGVNGYVGGDATFSVVANGAPTLQYQWTGPGGAIPGATNATLIVTNLNMTGTPPNQGPGNYSCTITNLYGSTNTSVAVLTVGSSPPFFVQDLPLTNYGIVGSPVTLSVDVGGNRPLTNQWYAGSTALHEGDRGGRVSHTTNLTLVIANAQTSDDGPYQIFVTNGIAPYFAASQVGQLVVEKVPLFNGSGQGWTLNGGATINSDVLTLTTGNNGEARSVWFNVPVYIGGFRAGFTYQAAQGSTGASLADGMSFCMQNSAAGLGALGGGGGSLGYQGIDTSAAVIIDLYNTRGYQYITGGQDPRLTGNYVGTLPTLDPGSGNPISATLVYNGSTLALTLTDTVTHGTVNTNIPGVRLSSVVGGNTALIGFTGATGGLNAIQTVSGFYFIPTPVLSVARSGGGVVISWPVGVGGYVLQQNSSLSNPGGWTPIPGPYNIVGSNYQVTVAPAVGVEFYRLVVSLP